MAGSLAGWIGVAGSIITIVMTVWNVQTKGRIDAQEQELKVRAASLDESKERVSRYTWVRGVFADLKTQDAQGKQVSMALIRLALQPDEAKVLFSGLAHSTDESLQEAGKSALSHLQAEDADHLILRINGEQSDDRKAALAVLTTTYKGSPGTITSVLHLFDENAIARLSGPGMINALFYLARTDPTVWSTEQITLAKMLITRLRNRPTGDQTRAQLDALDAFVKPLKPVL